MHELNAFLTANPYLIAAAVGVLGWLLHRRFGDWPFKSAQPKKLDRPEKTDQYASPMAQAFPGLTRADVRGIIHDELDELSKPIDGKPDPARKALDAAHVLLDIAKDHQEQLDDLAPVITALAQKAGVKA